MNVNKIMNQLPDKTQVFLICKKERKVHTQEYNNLHIYVEAMSSKIILMMPKNQDLSKFQRFKNQVLRIKIQEPSFKNQDSRIIKIKIQDSRFKNQEKTQS